MLRIKSLIALAFSVPVLLFAQVQIDKPVQLIGAGANAAVTGIKSVTNAQDATSVEAIQNGSLIYAVATGSGNAFDITISPAISAYRAGMVFNFISNQGVTGATTLNVNGLGAVAITKLVNQPLAQCDIQNGQMVTVVYDGTNFQVTSLLSGLPATPVISGNNPVCAGSILNLAIGSTLVGATYSWTGPNGFSSTSANPAISNFQSNNAGTYLVTITSNGCTSASGSLTVVIDAGPLSAFTYSPTMISPGTPVTFTPTTTGATYNWTFQSGTPSTSSAQNPSVSFSTGGNLNVGLTVTVNGCSSTTTNPVAVSASSPTLVCLAGDNITAGNTVGYKGCVTFNYNGSTVTYTTVRAGDGQEWLQENLGATQIALSSTDANAFGDLFQWGRWDDGHQLRTPANVTNGLPSPNNPSGISYAGPTPFYWDGSAPYWFDAGATTDTWTGTTAGDKTATNGIDPCKQDLGNGWHLPTTTGDWTAVFSAESIVDAASAYNSNLKLTMAGYRNGLNGTLSSAGSGGFGNYWGSGANTSNGTSGTSAYFDASSAAPAAGGVRVHGISVRCVK